MLLGGALSVLYRSGLPTYQQEQVAKRLSTGSVPTINRSTALTTTVTIKITLTSGLKRLSTQSTNPTIPAQRLFPLTCGLTHSFKSLTYSLTSTIHRTASFSSLSRRTILHYATTHSNLRAGRSIGSKDGDRFL